MPQITINGKVCEFEKGENILDVALRNEQEIPHYCYHPGLSAPANCRICLAEVWAPNPRNDNKLEAIPKLLPTCRTPCGEGQVVRTDSPKSIANQKAIMEYLLINHPVDCAVCDQAGECYLQDYSYQYGRGYSRFQEAKNKQPKKDVGPNILLYSDRCIMCTRCVRFTREVTGTGELMVDGRGSIAQIDVFPGMAVDNELAGNVIDLCPVGALLDKDFLFAQRVWFLKETPSIDPLTASGDNIEIHHNEGEIYRIKPRTNLEINKWWITDEVRYGWRFVHDIKRLRLPSVKKLPAFAEAEAPAAYRAAYEAVNDGLDAAAKNGRIALMLSPMLSCEDAYELASAITAIDPDAVLGIGPVPFAGEDKTFPGGFTVRAEKAPNARGIRRVLAKFTDNVLEFDAFLKKAETDQVKAVVFTGNYPSDWVTPELKRFVESKHGKFIVVIETLANALTKHADVTLPGATWAEKAGTFENVNNTLQAFERAIDPIDYCKSEAQLALDLVAAREGTRPAAYNSHATHVRMAEAHGLKEFLTDVARPAPKRHVESDMPMVEL